MLISSHVQMSQTVIALLYSDKHLIICKIGHLTQKKSIRDFELFVAGSFYHSNFSPLLPISKRDLSPRSDAPVWPFFASSLTKLTANTKPQLLSLSTRAPVPHFPRLTRLSKPFSLYFLHQKLKLNTMPYPKPTPPNNLLVLFWFFVCFLDKYHSPNHPGSKVRYVCSPPILPSLCKKKKNDLFTLWFLQPKAKTLILPTLLYL